MMNEKIKRAFTEQIKLELESAYIYLSMATYLYNEGFDGMAKWMRVQAQEEVEHAMKFFDHLVERGEKVDLLPLKVEKTTWESPLEAFKDAYQHEIFITGKINELMKLALEVGDHPARVLLDWFVAEQVEEEAQTSQIANMLEKIGNSPNGLFMLDRELGKRKS